MLIPVTRAPSIMSRTFSGNLAPSVASLCTHLPAMVKLRAVDIPTSSTGFSQNQPPVKYTRTYSLSSTVKSAGSSNACSRIPGLFGLRNSDQIVGATILRDLMNRRFLSASTTNALEGAPPLKFSREPYASVIKELEPEFLKAGFIKTVESDKEVRFSIGPNQFLKVEVFRNTPPAISFVFIGNKHNHHFISELMKQFEPTAFEKRILELDAVIQKYELADIYTPKEIRDEGARIYLLMIFRQVMSFLASNRKALAELPLAESPQSLKNDLELYGSAIKFSEPQFQTRGSKLGEPYGSVIQMLEPEFLKSGFIKTGEMGNRAIFSFGANQSVEFITGRPNISSIAAYYFDGSLNQNYVSYLMKKFDPARFEKDILDQNATRKKYGLDDNDTPKELKNEGTRIYLALLLRQIISFLESNKKTLAEKSLLL